MLCEAWGCKFPEFDRLVDPPRSNFYVVEMTGGVKAEFEDFRLKTR